jgi:hypothetical protein
VKKYKLLKETTHRRTYNRVRKTIYAISERCPWKALFWWQCSDHYFVQMTYTNDGTNTPYALRFKDLPNWKLVSKNKKQWMKKNSLQESTSTNGIIYIRFGW